jgi:cold shock CspA family protein
MEANRSQGRLERWNDNRGFGFIHPEGDSRDVFVHDSAFKTRLNRRPRVGDVILYEIHTEQDGRVRAVNATIEGLVFENHTKPPKIPR